MGRERDGFRWLPGLAVAALAWLSLFPITSVDAYYHLAVGKRILDEGAIPSRGVGSATFGQAPWHDNEWGFQLLAALVGRTERDADGVLVLTPAGRAGLVILRALSLAATLALVSASLARQRVVPLGRAVAVVLAGFLMFGNLFWDVRPQILSYLAFAAIAYLLERDREGARWAGPATLAVVALWSNVHGMFIVGVVLLGAEACGDLLEGFAKGRKSGGEARRRGLRLAVCTALSPAAACLNPHGYLQVLHPFLYMLRPEIHAANAEWERPDLFHLPLLVLTFALTVFALVSRGRGRPAEWLRLAAFGSLFLTAIRHLPILTLVLAPLLWTSLAAAAGRGGWRRWLDPTGPGWGTRGTRAAAAAGIVAAVVALSGARFFSPWPRFEEGMIDPMPEKAVRFLAREGVAGSGLDTYRFGGFLTFRLYPAEKVFMDGRNDLYGDFRHEVYNPILQARPGWKGLWESAVRRYDVGWVLVDEGEPIVEALRSEPGWLMAPDGSVPAIEERPGRERIALILRDTPDNRERLPRLLALAGGAS